MYVGVIHMYANIYYYDLFFGTGKLGLLYNSHMYAKFCDFNYN